MNAQAHRRQAANHEADQERCVAVGNWAGAAAHANLAAQHRQDAREMEAANRGVDPEPQRP